MMVIPVSQHKLIKIRRVNRRWLTLLAMYCGFIATSTNILGATTNSWLYTSEVLKYYIMPNSSAQVEDIATQPIYYKNASYGPWKFCWLDPQTPFECHQVQYLIDEDPNDVTTGVQQSIRKSFYFMVTGVSLSTLGTLTSMICAILPNPYASLFLATVIHINAGLFPSFPEPPLGITNFLCVIVFMSSVSKEVGYKIYPASKIDEPLFHYDYGYSFWLLKVSFILTEFAALFSIVVYMAKRDERTFNRYKLRSMLNVHKMSQGSSNGDRVVARENGHIHPRYKRTPPSSIASVSSVPTLDELAPRRFSVFSNQLEPVKEGPEKFLSPSSPYLKMKKISVPLDILNPTETCL